MSEKRYPPCEARQIIKAAKKLGYYEAGRKGSHVTLKRDDPPHLLTIPAKGEIKATGTRISIIKALERNNPGVDIPSLIYGER